MQDEVYLQRCLHLAQMAGNRVYPNPRVGALLVARDRVLSEGFHAYAGGPHAEAVAIRSASRDASLAEATLYVSLEPCNHHGKTPPCTELILEKGIPRVVIGCVDPNPKVSGKGILRLKEAGVTVDMAPDPRPFYGLNRVFWINQVEKRPYIVLKWAQTHDGFVAAFNSKGAEVPLRITGHEAQRHTHQLRAFHHSIMVGRKTAEIDNPRLTTRHFYGHHPIRIVWDMGRKLPSYLAMLSDGHPTLVLTDNPPPSAPPGLRYLQPSQWTDMRAICQELFDYSHIASIIVEGGTHLLQQFIDQDVYDELHVFRGKVVIGKGVPAPVLPKGFSFDEYKKLGEDELLIRRRQVIHPDRMEMNLGSLRS